MRPQWGWVPHTFIILKLVVDGVIVLVATCGPGLSGCGLGVRLPSLLLKVNFLYVKWRNHSRRWEDNIEVHLHKVGLGTLTGLIFSVQQ
jgi:hypothetical protein